MSEVHILSGKGQESANARAAIVDPYAESIKQSLINLYSRWQDEKEYEPFNQYELVMARIVGNKFIMGNKSPFGVVLEFEHFPYNVLVFVNSREYGWKAVKK